MIAELSEPETRMPYVKFERRAVENKAESLKQGRYVGIDQDYALITPPYSKDVMIHKVDTWLNQLYVDQQNGRINQAWVEQYRKMYQAWQTGQELPVNGTPIKTWGVISPAQQETLIRMHVLTVEQLADMNDEGVRRVGMGGLDMKNKAEAWLKQLKSKGATTMEIAALKKENAALQTNLDALSKQLEQAIIEMKFAKQPDNEIKASDLFGDDD